MTQLDDIVALSRRYGADSDYTLAGGGNTSCKDEHFLYVKPSGVALATIKAEDFVKMDRPVIRQCFSWAPIADKTEREERIKKLMAFAVISGGRPSVEAPVHEVMPYRLIVHMHPALVNGLTCSRNGRKECARLFPDALWIDYCDPGYTLSKRVHDENAAWTAARGQAPQVIFLQNHGVFVAGDDPETIDRHYRHIMNTLRECYAQHGISTGLSASDTPDSATVAEFAPRLRGHLGEGRPVTVTAGGWFRIPRGPLTPDHMVYAKAFGLVNSVPDRSAVDSFKSEHGYVPRMVEVPDRAVFCAGKDKKAADTALALARNGALIAQLAEAFGGPRFMDDAQRRFIENWEVESYRAKVAGGSDKPLSGLVAVVTGGAQGFGYGIAEHLAGLGADLVIADMNADGAAEAARRLGPGASGFAVNVADEESVAALTASVTAAYGGVDLLVSNAGVVRANSVKAFDFKDWKFVTDVNYNGFFLCVKHFAALMSVQNAATGLWSDIIQVNSKSGLEGSRNNAAYAGSKFGSIGLVQSFALELVADRIKVNAVCPGNYLDGPLWSNPEKGLFVQYLKAGKVPGAKTVAEVKAHYENLVPMRRGCYPEDVAKAIVYAVTQQYETGQAIPVTGGQVMLN